MRFDCTPFYSFPGTDAERGLTVWRALSKGADSADTVARSRGVATYDLPVGMEWLRRYKVNSWPNRKLSKLASSMQTRSCFTESIRIIAQLCAFLRIRAHIFAHFRRW